MEPGPGIRHRDFDHVVRDLGVRGAKLPLLRLRHRLQGVAEQIDQNLLNLDPIHQDQIDLRVHIEAKLYVLFSGAGQPERARLLNQF